MSQGNSSNSIKNQNSSFRVYYSVNQTLVKLNFEDSNLRVAQVISRCIRTLQDQHRLNVNSDSLHYALFPATKKGVKLQNSIQITHGQKIKSLGFTKFYLQYLNPSKQSISTDINSHRQKLQQKDKRDMGCNCLFKF